MSQMRPGDWNCPSCNNHNFSFRDECKRCGATKEVGDIVPPRSGSQGGDYRGGGGGGGVGQGSGTFAAFDSIAPPTYENPVGNPPSYSLPPPSSQPMNGGDFYGGGGKGRGTGGGYYGGNEGQPPSIRGDMSGGNRDVKPGDWICSNCGNNNFAKRYHCNRCRTSKEQGHTVSGENPHLGGYVEGQLRPDFMGSGGHIPPNLNVKPGDWICGNCQNNNFAWRPECNRCRMPKSDYGKGGKGGYGKGDYGAGGKGRDFCYDNFDGKGGNGKGDYGSAGGKGRDFGYDNFDGKGGNGKGDYGSSGGKGQDFGYDNFRGANDGYGKGGYGKGMGGGGKGNSDRFPGDWDCQHCGNNNFARRTECNRCGAPNTPPVEAPVNPSSYDSSRYAINTTVPPSAAAAAAATTTTTTTTVPANNNNTDQSSENAKCVTENKSVTEKKIPSSGKRESEVVDEETSSKRTKA